jgi:hypothetical protein
MLIVSKFRDYYDSSVGVGIDKTIVYERHEKEIECPKKIFDVLNLNWSNNFTNTYYRLTNGMENSGYFVIGFCGKLYVGYKFTKKIDLYTTETEIIYDEKTALEKFDFENKKNRWRKNSERFRAFNDKIKSVDTTEWFRELNTPIFVFGNIKEITGRLSPTKDIITINPNLKDFMFMKVMDSFTAFQEIQMYISGVLGVNKDGSEIVMTEKEKVMQHGFDKWSFRKEPSK